MCCNHTQSLLSPLGVDHFTVKGWVGWNGLIIIIIIIITNNNNNNNGFSSGTPTSWLFVHCFQIELKFGMLVFVEGRKPENPEKNPRSKDENQQQTQPTCDAKVQESNLGHSSGRQALSPLLYPCSLKHFLSL